jgi:hypothetical protein
MAPIFAQWFREIGEHYQITGTTIVAFLEYCDTDRPAVAFPLQFTDSIRVCGPFNSVWISRTPTQTGFDSSGEPACTVALVTGDPDSFVT